MNQAGEHAAGISAADVFDALTTGIALLDDSLCFVHVNPAFCEMTGAGARRLLDQPLSILHPEPRLDEAARRVQKQTASPRLDAVVICAQPGGECTLDISMSAAGAHVLLEVRPTNASQWSSRVSESLRGFAHEVRNPLAAISGAAQLLERNTSDKRTRELAQLIREESMRLAALSERLLGARNATTLRAVNVHAVLERVAELLEAEHASAMIVRDYDPSLPAWHGDPDRLLQAVLNLVRNAIEANAQHVVLRSRAEAGWRDARGQRVPALRIEIEDDGDGVPDPIAATLFEPMVSGRADGSGLGLALAREIAREHGGELTYRRCGRGSCFVVLLPRHPRAGERE